MILDQTKYYKVSEVAKIFDVTNYTVRTWINTGKIKATKSPGGQWRIAGTEIKGYAQKEFGNANQ
jgi:excisionase family DNA binding protein